MTPQERKTWIGMMGARGAWWNLRREAILEPDWECVDTHFHLWEEQLFPDPQEGTLSLRTSRYLLDEFLEDACAGHKVTQAVYVECGSEYRTEGPSNLRVVGETEFAARLARQQAGKSPQIGAIVAHADLCDPDLETVLDAHREAGGDLFRGVRQSGARLEDPAARLIAGAAPPGLYADPAFQRGLALLGDLGLVFDSFQFHFQLDDLEALARSGIGKLTLIDLDDVCVSNVNRQLHALDGTIGQPKVDVLAERCRLIAPEIEIIADTAFVTPTNLAERIPEDADHVVDAIDSVIAKAALIAWCKRRKIPITVTGAAGGQTDPTRIQVADLTRTEHDPLLSKVRSRLRRDYGFSRNPKRRFSVECVYSDEQLIYPSADGEVCLQKPGSNEATRLDCASGFGAATFLTGTFGFVAASKVLERLAKKANQPTVTQAIQEENE